LTEKNYKIELKDDLDVKLLFELLREMDKNSYKLSSYYRYGKKLSVTIGKE
jgi:hypothetical protein